VPRFLPSAAVIAAIELAMSVALDQIRICPRDREGIRRATVRACHEAVATWRRIIVFGSRTNPRRRGGDIDLLLEIAADPPTDTYRLKQRLRLALEDELGPQHFDIVLDDGTAADGFVDLARSQGVELWSNS
jgi:predicted nucleotidyltransferase